MRCFVLLLGMMFSVFVCWSQEIEQCKTDSLILSESDSCQIVNLKNKEIRRLFQKGKKELFKKYGRAVIKKELPCDTICLCVDNLIFRGRIKRNYKGGTFLMIISYITNEIVCVSHSK